MVILERRNGAGKVLYKPVQGGWNGSEEDKHKLLEELERLRKDPSILTHDAMLPELNNEFASVSRFKPPSFNGFALNGKLALTYLTLQIYMNSGVIDTTGLNNILSTAITVITYVMVQLNFVYLSYCRCF